MFSKSLSGLLAASLLTLVVGSVGCKSEHAAGTHTMPDGTVMAGTSHELMCPKCETVWSTETTGQGTRTVRTVSKKDMTCPTCNAMADSYMKDGAKVLHDCPDCKVTPVEIKRATAPPKTPRG